MNVSPEIIYTEGLSVSHFGFSGDATLLELAVSLSFSHATRTHWTEASEFWQKFGKRCSAVLLIFEPFFVLCGLVQSPSVFMENSSWAGWVLQIRFRKVTSFFRSYQKEWKVLNKLQEVGDPGLFQAPEFCLWRDKIEEKSHLPAGAEFCPEPALRLM